MALNLLFHIPLFWAVIVTAFDVLVLLSLRGLGVRVIEAVILVLVATIGGCYFLEIFILPQTRPDFVEMGQALLTPTLRGWDMVALAVGIVGATVMPHNLYLHSALVQSRREGSDDASIRTALRFNTIDSVAALTLAFFVNAAILVLAAVVFSGAASGFSPNTNWLTEAYRTLTPVMGTAAASVLFAVALLASGQSSTITGTMAGQVVMEGFLHWRVRPWVRRLVTRLLAVLPAVLIIGWRGEGGVMELFLLSQIVLAFQLPFAMIPLMQFTSSRRRMGTFANGWFLLITGWGTCLLITGLDVWLIGNTIFGTQ